MLRRTVVGLGGGLVPFHDWILREPLCQNYEGWRILDNPKMTKWECWAEDIGGYVRHLDPIIDDPRLKHSQRVCRLYRWALKELKAYMVSENGYKFNIAYKVIRNRFEKYRYVTDPAMCDMMVRETQKYLRETCSPSFYRLNPQSPGGTLVHAAPTFHPDHAQVYDHWTHPEVFWYDDAKLHRFHAQHPMTSAGGEFGGDRYGEIRETGKWWRKFQVPVFFLYSLWQYFWLIGGFQDAQWVDPRFDDYTDKLNPCLRQSIDAEERAQRAKYMTSVMGHDWDQIVGAAINQKDGMLRAMGRFRVPGGQKAVDPA